MRAGPAAALAAALIAFLGAGLWLGGHPGDLPGPLQDVFVDETAALSGEAAEIIEDTYYREVPRSRLNDGSVEGMVDALRRHNGEDRFSHYFDPEQAQLLEEQTEGRFSGVGLSVTEVRRGLKVIEVFEDSPAAKAGIRPDDVIVSVNGESIAGQSSQLSTAKIKGPAGTEVTLGVRRPSSGETRQVRIERQEIRTPVVESSLRTVDSQSLGHLRLLGFSQGAHGALREAVQRLRRRGAGGIVLDLRGNPGGLLTEAVLTASVFLPESSKVVTTKSRAEGGRVYRAQGDPVPRRPMVVLIDRNTASAAEILASALADHGLAEVVGTRSFGKGLFQHVVGLSNGGELDLSVGKFFTADGISLAPKGIKPDVRASDRPQTEADEGLRRALAVLEAEVAGRTGG
ncbi:MAG: S41 family peptidase [Solirubrobacterales bacterium]